MLSREAEERPRSTVELGGACPTPFAAMRVGMLRGGGRMQYDSRDLSTSLLDASS